MAFYRGNNRQKGFLLLEALMLLTIAALAVTLYLSSANKDMVNNSLNANAVKWAGINNALRAYVSNNRVSIINGANVVNTDVKFLKNISCVPAGTSSVSYLPCNFDATFFLGLNTMAITVGNEFNVTGAGSTSVATAQMKIGPKLLVRGVHRIDLTELLISKSESRVPLISAPVGAATFVKYDYDKSTISPTFGTLISSVDTSDSNGAFLRIDGSNFMQADLRVGDGVTKHDIVSIRDVVSGRDITMTGNGTYGGALSATGNISSTLGNVTAAGNIVAGTGITATSGNITASSGNINATTGNITASTGNVTAGGTILGGDVRTFGTNGLNGRSLKFATAEAGVVQMTLVGTVGTAGSYLAANVTKPICDGALIPRPFGSVPHKAYSNGDPVNTGEDLEAVDSVLFWSYRYRIYSQAVSDWVSPSPATTTFLQYSIHCLP